MGENGETSGERNERLCYIRGEKSKYSMEEELELWKLCMKYKKEYDDFVSLY